jgi:PKD repeat protein
MRSGRFTLLLGLVLLAGAALTGCLGQMASEPRALFTASSVEEVIPFTANFDGSLSYAPTGTIISYIWDFGDGGGSSGPLTSHVFRDDNVYTVKLTVFDDRGTSGSTTLSVTALNPLPTASFVYSPKYLVRGEYVVSCTELLTFDGSASADDGQIAAYEWNFGDGTTATGIQAEHRYNYPGKYNVVLTAIDDDGAFSRYVDYVIVVGSHPCGDGTTDGGTCP